MVCSGAVFVTGDLLRFLFEESVPEGLVNETGFYVSSRGVVLFDDTPRPLFHELTDPCMGKERRRG